LSVNAGPILEDLSMERRLPEQERPPLWDENSLHLSGEALEAYSLNRISDEELLAGIEEHLLVCAHCQRQVEKLDSYHAAVREALPLAAVAAPAAGKTPIHWQRYAIAAGLVGLLFIPVAVERMDAPYAAELVATRAEQRVTLPAERKLELQLDRQGLPTGELAWTLVSAEGAPQAEGRVAAEAKIWLPGLTVGAYWLRLATPAAPDTPLREFSLVVQ
jgi:hypothetical protein